MDTGGSAFGSAPGDGSAMEGDTEDITTSITASSAEDGDDGDASVDGTEEDDDDSDGPLDAADDDMGETTMSVDPDTGDDTTGGGEEGTTDGGTTDDGSESTGTEMMCSQDTNCAGAAGLGTVSGDTSSPDLQYEGTQPIWLEFHVTEDNEDVLGEQLRFTVTLTSPACCDFDLYVYRGTAGGSTGCNGTLQSSISVGAVDTVTMSWGEGAVANGVDDDSWIALEVVPKNDECQDDQPWSLLVEGDT